MSLTALPSLIDRKAAISRTFRSIAFGCASISSYSFPTDALVATATTDTDIYPKKSTDKIEYFINNFSVTIPSNWLVTIKPTNISTTSNKMTTKNNSKLFSAIDIQSGSVITVVKEQACNVQEYAQSMKACDIVLTTTPTNSFGDDGKSNKISLFSEETIEKDVSKLLIRYDDRDNAVLQGTTKLNSYSLNNNKNLQNNVF